MASNWKVIQFFDAGGNGWTEFFTYIAAGALPALADMASLITLRKAFLAPNGQILGVRATMLDPP